MAPICTFAEASKLLNYKSRSTLYRLKKDGWLSDYIINYAGKDHLDMKHRGKPKLGDYSKSIIQWTPSKGNHIQNQKPKTKNQTSDSV